jgi:hypothetical protein
MHTGFGRQQAVRILAGDRHRDAFQAGFVSRLVVDDFALEPAALDPPHIHPHQHLGPVERLGAAGARMNRHDGVLAVVLAAEHLLDLAAFDEPGEFLHSLREIGNDILALLTPVDEHGEIVAFRFQRRNQLDFFFDAAAALEDFLRFGLVIPEVWGRGPGFYLRELFCWAGGLKDNSGDPRRASRGPDICG